MRKNFGAKPWTYPQPVFILSAYDENGTPNAMNAAWGGISEDKELSMCISEGHKTTANILARKAFTVSMATADQMVSSKVKAPKRSSSASRMTMFLMALNSCCCDNGLCSLGASL